MPPCLNAVMPQLTVSKQAAVLLAVLVAAAVVIMAFYMHRTGGTIEAMDGRLQALESRIAAFDGRFDINDENLGALRRDIAALSEDEAKDLLEPSDVLGAAGVPVDEWYFSLRVGGRIYVFPRHEMAAGQLRDAGFRADAITPYLTGYRLD